jgi:hypothetical protein
VPHCAQDFDQRDSARHSSRPSLDSPTQLFALVLLDDQLDQG